MRGHAGGTPRQRLPTYQRTSSVPSSTARSSPEGSTGEREGLFARIDQLEMAVTSLAAENDVLEKKIRPQVDRLGAAEKMQPASNQEPPTRSSSGTVDHSAVAENGALVQTISDLQNKVLALEAELSQEKQSKAFPRTTIVPIGSIRSIPTPQVSGPAPRVGSPPRQSSASIMSKGDKPSPVGCSSSTQKMVRSPSPGRGSPSPSRALSKPGFSIARSLSEEKLLGWYRQQKPAHRTPERFRTARLAVEKNRRSRPAGTGSDTSCPSYQRPTAASNAGRHPSAPRSVCHPNRSAATPQRRRSKSPPKTEEVEVPVSLWESLNEGLSLSTPDKGHWICGDRCMRGEHFEPYRPVVPTTTGNFLFKAPPPGFLSVPGAARDIAKEREGTCTPPWARASATSMRGRLASGDVSVSDATTPRVSVMELATQIVSQLRDRYGALEIAGTHAAVALGICDRHQLDEYITARVRNGLVNLHSQDDLRLQSQLGSRCTTLMQSQSLSAIHKALPPIRFTVEEFEESLLDFFKLGTSRKDVRRVFHMVDRAHGRIGLIELPHLAEDYQHMADELEASLSHQRSLSNEQCSTGMRDCSPMTEHNKAITIEEARQRRRSPRSQIVVAPQPEIPASGASLVEHANAVLLSTLRTEDLSARPSPRRSPAWRQSTVSPATQSTSILTQACTKALAEPLVVAQSVCDDGPVTGAYAAEEVPLSSTDSDETSDPVSRMESSNKGHECHEVARLISAESVPTEHDVTEQDQTNVSEQPISIASDVATILKAEVVPDSPATVQTVHSIAEIPNLAQLIHSKATVRPPKLPHSLDTGYEIRMPMKGDGGFSPPTPSGWSTPSQVPSLQGSQAVFATPGCTPQTGGATPASCVTPAPTPPVPQPPPNSFPAVVPPKGVSAAAVGPVIPRVPGHGWDLVRNRVHHGGLVQHPHGMSPRTTGGPYPYPSMR
eukprot:gnl/MRDRNA2_/MRDRNA2_81864_c0_seq1.p1 gnl/MRDRNA2_/MRDRNA2_81864_c0~~gnl/MRDRNA2_/MRDRNA2_81864_c0_seq1.p1  ORF type:complete len:949 (-),score=161.57 gnl/MRDRNA2_/MRDRNA2_81864_c0_seq1:56-2902(-)